VGRGLLLFPSSPCPLGGGAGRGMRDFSFRESFNLLVWNKNFRAGRRDNTQQVATYKPTPKSGQTFRATKTTKSRSKEGWERGGRGGQGARGKGARRGTGEKNITMALGGGWGREGAWTLSFFLPSLPPPFGVYLVFSLSPPRLSLLLLLSRSPLYVLSSLRPLSRLLFVVERCLDDNKQLWGLNRDGLGVLVFSGQRWNSWIRWRLTKAKAFTKDVSINQERKLRARQRSDTALVSTINDTN